MSDDSRIDDILGEWRARRDAGERVSEGEVIAANPAQVEQFRAGKQQVLGFLVGQVMKASRGNANPQQVNEALRKKLGA